LTQGVARLSEQLKVSQEQVARDNANRAEQIKEIQDQLAGVISRASEPNARQNSRDGATDDASYATARCSRGP